MKTSAAGPNEMQFHVNVDKKNERRKTVRKKVSRDRENHKVGIVTSGEGVGR